MFYASFSQRVLVVGLLTALLAGGSAFAERGGRGGGGRSGSGDGGGRSFSRGGGGGGGGGGGQSRSFSRGDSGDSSRSMPSRSFSGGSSRSFSAAPRPSFRPSESTSGSARQYVRPSESGSSRSFSGQPSTRSFNGQQFSRGSSDSGQTVRSFERSPSVGRAVEGDTPRSFNRSDSGDASRGFTRSQGDSSQYSRSFGNPQSQQQSPSDSSSASRRFDRSDSNNGPPTSQRDYTARRPTNDQVRDFLQMRRDGTSNQPGNASNQLGNSNRSSGNASLDQRRFNGNAGRGDDTRGATNGVTDVTRQQSFRNRVSESQNEGDRAWSRRFGDGDNNRGDQTARNDNDGPRTGDFNRRPGDLNRSNDGRGDNDRKFTNNDRNRDFGDRKFVDSKYQSWRKDAWRGDDGKGRDHRDWSGRWKDGDRFVAANQIRNHWHGGKDRNDFPFRSGWNNRHWHGGHNHWNRWDYWGGWASFHRRPWYWWSWCPAPRLTTWVNFGWSTPYYWDYGPGEYIYCYDNVIYVNGRWFQPAPIYYENTVVLAQRAPDWTPEQAQQIEWLPLGVFAVARDGVPDSNMLVQLAVTKDGVIGGTATNQLTGASFPVEGTVDKETQRAVWMYTDDKNARIVMETSVYNLTQPESTGLVHYGPDDIQVAEFVRLEQPEAGAAPAATTPPAAVGTGVLPSPKP